MAALGWVVFFIASMVGTTAFRGFILSKLWEWFMVPLGLPHVGIALAIGISMVIQLLAGTNLQKAKASNNDDEHRSLGSVVLEATFTDVFAMLLTWLFGWIVQGFI